MANIKNAVKLGVFTLAIMNVTAVVSLRGLPAEAVYGMSCRVDQGNFTLSLSRNRT